MTLAKTPLLLCALSTTMLFADNHPLNDEIALGEKGSLKILMAEKNVLVVQKDGGEPAQKTGPEVQPTKPPTPPDMVQFDNCCRPFATVDYLFWTAREDNLSYAFPYSDVLVGETLVKSHVRNPDGKWGSGFRIGAGLNFKYDGWDTYVNYTRFHPEASKGHLSLKGNAETIFPTWDISVGLNYTQAGPVGLGAPIPIPILSAAKTRWGVGFDEIDWELGRRFFVGTALVLRPFVGVKTAWIEQNHLIALERETDGTIFAMKNHLHSWGFGLRFGIDSVWYVYRKNLSVIGDLALSTLWTHFNASQKQTTSILGTIFQARDSYHTIKPVIEGSLGMQWESWFFNESLKLSFRAAWEEQLWINHNQLPEYLHTNSSFSARGGDLFLQGLTLRARFDY